MQKGIPSKKHDILNDNTFKQLCEDAKAPRQIWHFGMPCGSFSILQGLNKGTRSQELPAGDGSLSGEIHGNEILRRTVILCDSLHEHGSFFTIENQKSSYAWHMPDMTSMLRRTNSKKINLDQCQYGLSIPDCQGMPGPARKATSFAGTLPKLEKPSKTVL